MNMIPSNSKFRPPIETRTPVRQVGVLSLFGLFISMWFKLFKFSIQTAMRATRALVRYEKGNKVEQSRIGKETVE